MAPTAMTVPTASTRRWGRRPCRTRRSWRLSPVGDAVGGHDFDRSYRPFEPFQDEGLRVDVRDALDS